MAERKIRVLLAKLGLDSHTVGVTVIAQSLRDAGMEVIYTGLRQTPDMVVQAALQEDVDVIGISSLSGAQMQHIPKVLDKLREAGVNEGLQLGGILMTMFDQRTNLGHQVVGEVRNHFDELVFRTTIPRSIRLSEAPSFGQSIFEYDPGSSGAHAYLFFAEELIKRFELAL